MSVLRRSTPGALLRTCCVSGCVFFFKQKTAYEMRISDWSSDVCSSDLRTTKGDKGPVAGVLAGSFRSTTAFSHLVPTTRRPSLQPDDHGPLRQIGRASCRERVCQYV